MKTVKKLQNGLRTGKRYRNRTTQQKRYKKQQKRYKNGIKTAKNGMKKLLKQQK